MDEADDKKRKANTYLLEHKAEVNSEYRLKYHLMPPIGWMNDPNGFSYYGGYIHLYYQHYPYQAAWNDMYWGHAVTKDFIVWEDKPIALAPDKEYDKAGCFSGTAIQEDGIQYLMYTCVKKEEKKDIQQQAMAYSKDGITYEKFAENPVITTKQLPETIYPSDFRDPKIWKEKDIYYCAVVAMDCNVGGRLLLYTSNDLKHWEYQHDIMQPDKTLGTMWECPDYFTLDGEEIVFLSIIDLQTKGYEFWNKQACVMVTGTFDKEKIKFSDYQIKEIDFGFNFYAPQTMLLPDGRRIMTAWMQAWEETMPTQQLNHLWAGAMILPRELRIKQGVLYQKPVKEIEKYRRNEIIYHTVSLSEKRIRLPEVSGSCLELEAEFEINEAQEVSICMFAGKKGSKTDPGAILTYNKQKQELIFSREQTGIKIQCKDYEKPSYRKVFYKAEKQLKYRIFIDTCSVEIFVGDGEITITSLIFPIEKEYGIEFFSVGNAKLLTLKKWNLEI